MKLGRHIQKDGTDLIIIPGNHYMKKCLVYEELVNKMGLTRQRYTGSWPVVFATRRDEYVPEILL